MTAADYSQIALILGLILKVVYDIVKDIITVAREKQQREQDRLDRTQLAELTLVQLEQVKKKGDERLKKIVAEVQEVKKVAVAAVKYNKEAIEVANGHNAKIASAVELSSKVLEKLESPSVVQQVEVMNTPQHPVPIQPAE